tara:strand:- start:1225 stop:1401 length:177 start_codon:yes stop_codon:yes gene_type:complete
MNREKYIENYKSRNGSTKNASKSYNRYLEGITRQNNQAKRQASFRARVLEAQQKRDSK